MKKVLLLSAAILALAAPVATAQGLNIAYFDCGGPLNLNDACTATSGAPYTFMTSVVAPAVPNFVGAELVLDLQVDAAGLPDWWRYDLGGCRNNPPAATNKMIANFNFAFGPFTCLDPWGGAALGGFQYQVTAADRARIKVAAAIQNGVALSAGDEYYLAAISMLKTLSTSCVGCLTPACIVFNSAKLAQPAGQGDFLVTTPAVSQHITWQGGGSLLCPEATPTQSNSWGEIKAMYR